MGSGMSIDLFIDRAGRASSRSPQANPVSLDDPCVPGAERRDTRSWREQRDGQDPSLVHRWDRCVMRHAGTGVQQDGMGRPSGGASPLKVLAAISACSRLPQWDARRYCDD